MKGVPTLTSIGEIGGQTAKAPWAIVGQRNFDSQPMTDTTSHTAHYDAPPSSLEKSEVTGIGGELAPQHGDVLVGGRPRQEPYSFWRDFTDLPRFKRNVHKGKVLSTTRFHWVIDAPGGKTVVRNSGLVEFLDSSGDRRTAVRVRLVYDPPGGSVGALIAKIFRKEPKVQARQRVRRFRH